MAEREASAVPQARSVASVYQAGLASAAEADERARVKQIFDGLAQVAGGPQFLRVSLRQKDNPLIKELRNVPFQLVSDVTPDFIMGKTTCALFLSLRYHNLHPEYIHARIREVGRLYALRVLLVQVDVRHAQSVISDLAKLCVMHDYTLIVAGSIREAARYLELYKSFENKSAELLQGEKPADYLAQLVTTLTTFKTINKTDAVTLLSTFSSLARIAKASKNELAACPGLGDKKVQHLSAILDRPFLKNAKRGAHARSSQGKSPSNLAANQQDVPAARRPRFERERAAEALLAAPDLEDDDDDADD